MKRNLAPLLGIALVVAIASTGVFYGLFVGKLKSTALQGPQIVVAARALAPGERVAAADVRLAVWPGDVPAGAFTEIDSVSGAKVTEALAAGEALVAGKLAATNRAQAARSVPSGFRAVSVSVWDSAGVVSMLRAGQKVDVQVVRVGSQETEVRTALQNLEVLLVDEGERRGNEPVRPVVTLLARPNEADVLALADAAARIRLILRNPDDGVQNRTGAIRLAGVMQGETQPADPRAK
jgi:Flp pilus assembly protein CpaB